MAGINIRSAADIISASSSSNAKIARQSDSLKIANANVINPAKYIDRSELDSSGLAREYDNMQRMILNSKSYDTSASIVDRKLANEQNFMIRLNDAMKNFENEISNHNQGPGTPEDKVNKALLEISTILKLKDTSGNYIIGGNDPRTNPLSKLDENGNRISVDLLKDSNFIDGVIIENYSDISPERNLITASSQHKVQKSVIYPGIGAIAKTIGYLNAVKEHYQGENGAPSIEILENMQVDQIDSRRNVKMSIDLERSKIEEALIVNKNDFIDAEKMNQNHFLANMVERAQVVKDLLQSLNASISLAPIADKSFQTMLDKLRV